MGYCAPVVPVVPGLTCILVLVKDVLHTTEGIVL